MVFEKTNTHDSKDFIQKLQLERTDYKYASQVRTIAKSLIQLSVGIYTEPERFVYELLQNAVDAFADTGNDSLEILIKADQDKFVFMHNGKPFNEKDVEGICDVGNGTKANDSKKIGYKGIGFKSVFMPSVNHVSIISGQYCFEFDKQKARSLMPSFPASEGVLGPNDVPWQVIPIDAPQLKELRDPRFNVITIVYTQEANKIGSRIEHLFSDLQFLLFLRSDNVNIRFERNGQFVFSVGKKQVIDASDNMPKVTLYKNDQPLSSWMLYTKGVIVPPDVKTALEHDFNTPDKLKGAESVEISFAVQTKQNEVVRLKDTSVFTFLPTSYRSLQQPFLINSNFITDAGRQQLHQESEWNKLIFCKIPELYLDFVSTFSSRYSNYTEVLPTRYPDNDTLVGVYREALTSAFSKIAFIPNQKGTKLLKIRDVLVDETGISKSVVSTQTFFNHFNKTNNVSFSEDNLVNNQGIVDYAHDIIKRFVRNDLYVLLGDSSIYQGWSIDDDYTLINYLYSYYKKTTIEEGRNNFREILQRLPFLIDEEGEWKCPGDLYLPSDFREQNQLANGVSFIDDHLLKLISQSDELLAWLRDDLGIGELDNNSFANYICSHPDYITTNNAVDVGLLLFKVWKDTPQTIEKNSDRGKIKLLTKNGLLKTASELFLSDNYDPKLKLEQSVEEDIFPSSDYCIRGEEDRLKMFFKILGISEDIELKDIHERLSDVHSSRFDYPFFQKVIQTSRLWGNTYNGFKVGGTFTFFPQYIKYPSYSLLYLASNYSAAKTILTRVFSQPIPPNNKNITVYGVCGFWDIAQRLSLLSTADSTCPKDYLQWVFENCQIIPTTLKTCQRASTVYAYSESTFEIASKYLPVFDAGAQIDDSWRQLLPFKQNLSLRDLLSVLEEIELDDDEKEVKKERVSRIYREIIDRDNQCSPEISEWATSHNLLSQSGEFLPATELTYITVDGFKNSGSKVYCDKVGQGNRDKLLQLLKTFGVQVITQKEITTEFIGSVENDDLKNRLLNKVQYLAILRDTGKLSFDERKAELEGKIQETHFYKCDSISLTYGEDNDTISKSTFSKGDRFYYTGKITPALMEPLLSPLCSYLNLGSSNDSKLMVILITDDHESLSGYLEDCGYDVSKLLAPRNALPELPVSGRTVAGTAEIALPTGERIVINRGNVDEVNQREINKEARIHAKPYLATHGYDVSQWEPETSLPDLVGIIKDPNGNPINVVIRSAKQRYIHLSASSFETLMTNPNNLLIVENHQGIRPITFEELFGNDSNVNLIFDARHTPREYFQALGIVFKYVKNTEFVVRDPHFSTYDEIKGFGLEMKNDGTILIASLEDI